MTTFHELLDSLKDADQARQLRLSLIRDIESETGRPLIVYAAAIAGKHPMAPVQIDVTDKTAFSDLIDGISGDSLDVLLHSPGGSAEAVEQIVSLLRARFKELRFIVPHTATSAATLMVLAGNTVLMDDRSTLGPIDPQIVIPIPNGQIRIPAHSYVQGFERAKEAIEQQPEIAPAYLPLLNKYEMYLLEVCNNALTLSRSLAEDWLRTYMLKSTPDMKDLASQIAEELSDHTRFLSHQRPIGIKKAMDLGLNVTNLATLPKLRELVWKLYCTIELHFDRSNAVKLFENSRGVSYQRNFVVQQISIPFPIAPIPGQPNPPAVPPQG
jgi:ATP-dependent protease ClpP protease subunit